MGALALAILRHFAYTAASFAGENGLAAGDVTGRRLAAIGRASKIVNDSFPNRAFSIPGSPQDDRFRRPQ